MPNMYGPALDGSGTIKEVEVDEANVAAFKAAGYQVGVVLGLEVEPQADPEVKPVRTKANPKGK